MNAKLAAEPNVPVISAFYDDAWEDRLNFVEEKDRDEGVGALPVSTYRSGSGFEGAPFPDSGQN